MTTEYIWGRPSRRKTDPRCEHDPSIGVAEADASETMRPDPLPEGYVQLANVAMNDGARQILHDLSLELEPGSTNYLVGSTAQEQSALLTLLLGLQQSCSGTVRLDGVEISAIPLAERRARVTLALAEPWIVDGTIADNIAFGHPRIEREHIEQAATLACIDAFASTMEQGLDTKLSDEGPELTAAQRRLVGLARAVVRQPALLLIEEPTRDLDASSETLAIRAMQRVSEGRTTLVATPRRHVVRRNDRILRIECGRLADPSVATVDHTQASDTDWGRAVRRLGATQSVSAIDTRNELVPGLFAIALTERSTNTESWLAWDAEQSRTVNLKLPRRQPTTFVAQDELTRELRTSELLRHPGLARPLSAALGSPVPYTVYEHLEGRTLADLIGDRAQAPEPGLVLRIGYELARTLAYVHQRGFAHLDLRPENVVISSQGTIITDLKMALRFGDAKPRPYHPDQYGVLAAEQLRGGPAAASMDMFALGALLYQASNGVLATTANSSFGASAAVGSRPPRRRPHRHQNTAGAADRCGSDASAVTTLIERLTASDPAQRPTATEAVALVRPLLLTAHSSAAEPAVPIATPSPFRTATGRAAS